MLEVLPKIINLPDKSDKREENLFFINLIIENNICNVEQVNDFVGNKETLGNDFIYDFVDYLLKKGITKKEDLMPLAKRLKEFRNKFGRIAVELNKLTKMQVNNLLKKQETIKKQRGATVPLGELSKYFNVLNEDEIKNILEIQKKRLVDEDGNILFLENHIKFENIKKQELIKIINIFDKSENREENLFFIDIILENKICFVDQIKEFVEDEKSIGNDFIHNLVNYLLKKEITTKEDLYPLSQNLKKFRNRFGKIAIELNKLTKKQVDSLLKKQEIIKKQRGAIVPLGRLLRHFNLLSKDEISFILNIQKKRLVDEEGNILFLENENNKEEKTSKTIIFSDDSEKKDENIFFVNLIFENKICNIEQINDFISNKENLGDDFIPDIIDYLLSKGITNIEKLSPILNKLKEFRSRFGKIAIELKKLTKQQVDKLLLQQEIIKQKKGYNIPIGKLLRHFKILTEEEINDILIAQRVKLVTTNILKNNSIPKDVDVLDIEKVIQNYECSGIDLYNSSYDNQEFKNDNIKMEVGTNEMYAQIVYFNNKEKNKTVQELKKEFTCGLGAIIGIVDDEKIQRFIDNPILPFTFAKGIDVIKSQDARIIDKCIFLKINSLQKNITITKNKKTGKYEVPIIKKDGILQIKIPKKEGKIGVDIFGKKVYPLDANDDFIKIQKVKEYLKSIEISSYFDTEYDCIVEAAKAIKGGIPCINEFGELSVINKVFIDNDIILNDLGKNKELLFGQNVDFDLNINGSIKNVNIGCNNLYIKGSIKNSIINANSLESLNGIEYSNLNINEIIKVFNIFNSQIESEGNITTENISKSIIKCSYLCVESINESKIEIINGLKIREIDLGQIKEPSIIINSSIIYKINSIMSELIKCKDYIKQLVEIEKTRKKQINNFELDLKNEYTKLNNYITVGTNVLDKDIIILKDAIKHNTEKQNEILNILSKIPSLKSIVGSGEKKEQIIMDLKNFIEKSETEIYSLKKNFIETRKDPIIRILKTLSDIVIKTAYNKEFKIQKGRYNTVLYENLILGKDGLYKTELSEKKY